MKASDRKSAVIEVQKSLRALQKSGYNIGRIVPDGIYGKETEESVRKFQGIYGLPQTGKVDLFTWDAIRSEYLEAIRVNGDTAPIYPFSQQQESDSTGIGDRSSFVYIVQSMIETISTQYNFSRNNEIDGYYGEDTAAIIKEFQEKNSLSQTGVVNREIWNMLAASYNKYINRE